MSGLGMDAIGHSEWMDRRARLVGLFGSVARVVTYAALHERFASGADFNACYSRLCTC